MLQLADRSRDGRRHRERDVGGRLGPPIVYQHGQGPTRARRRRPSEDIAQLAALNAGIPDERRLAKPRKRQHRTRHGRFRAQRGAHERRQAPVLIQHEVARGRSPFADRSARRHRPTDSGCLTAVEQRADAQHRLSLRLCVFVVLRENHLRERLMHLDLCAGRHGVERRLRPLDQCERRIRASRLRGTLVGTAEGRIRPENAAALVGAGMVSVLLFPAMGLRMLRNAANTDTDV